MAKFKYIPGSWVKIPYHKIVYAGCTLAYAGTIDKKRQYISDRKYATAIIPVIAHFKIKWLFAGERLKMMPLTNKYQHLTINNEIDYQSFISLN